MALAAPIVQQFGSGSSFGALSHPPYDNITRGLLTSRNASREICLIGQPISALVDKMLMEWKGPDNGDFPAAHTEFCVAWPPTFPVGGSVEVVELRAAVSLDASTTAQVAAESNVYGGDPALMRTAALRSAAAEVCGRVVAVREDVVVGEEGVKVDAAGRASARLRMSAEHTSVTSCILASNTGIPSLESLQDAAPLMALPQAARDEAHRLLWRMMHEALPPNHSALPFDPDVFRSPLELLPPRLQAALSWAWSRHFRSFAHDFAFLLDCMPPGAGMNPLKVAMSLSETEPSSVVGPLTKAAATAATAGRTGGEAAAEAAHYHSVWMQMIGFLRDNDMFACLTGLVQAAFERGLTIEVPETVEGVEAVASTEALTASAATTIVSPSIDTDDDDSDVCNGNLYEECYDIDRSSSTVEVLPAYPSTSPSVVTTIPSPDDVIPNVEKMPQAAAQLLGAIALGTILVVLLVLRSLTCNGGLQHGAVAVQPLTAVLVAVTVAAATYYVHRTREVRNRTDRRCIQSTPENLLDAVHISTAVWYMAAAAMAGVAAVPVEATASAVLSAALWGLPTPRRST